MLELYEAAKALLAHRKTYFEAHPEMLDVVNGIEDSEYDQAWERLQNVVDNMQVGELSPGLLDVKIVVKK